MNFVQTFHKMNLKWSLYTYLEKVIKKLMFYCECATFGIILLKVPTKIWGWYLWQEVQSLPNQHLPLLLGYYTALVTLDYMPNVFSTWSVIVTEQHQFSDHAVWSMVLKEVKWPFCILYHNDGTVTCETLLLRRQSLPNMTEM